jgi:hypothetical protein
MAKIARPKKRKTSVHMRVDLLKSAHNLAHAADISFARWLSDAVSEKIQRETAQ